MDLQLLIESYKNITNKLLELKIDDNVDELICEINNSLDERQVIVEQIETFNEVIDQEELNQLALKDFQLTTKFEEIMLNLSEELKQVKDEKKRSSVKKKANRGYSNAGYQVDGYFIDKRK